MSNVRQVLTSGHIQYVIYLSFRVEVAQLLEAELPEAIIGVRIQLRVISAKSRATVVT